MINTLTCGFPVLTTTLLFLLIPLTFCRAQDDLLDVYFDCDDCDREFIKRNIDWVNYVRDQQDSDVHVWVMSIRNGGNGRKYLLRFIGRKKYESVHFELEKHIDRTKTQVETQKKLIETLAGGLMPFAVSNSRMPRITIENDPGPRSNHDSTGSSWNNWIFELGLDLEYSREVSRKDIEWGGEIEANRTTERWRIRTELEFDYEYNEIDRDDNRIISILNRYDFDGSVVKSLTDHWSAGIFSGIWKNSVENTALGMQLNGALEYNIFPYDQSHLREFTLAYFIGPRYMNYQEETIFGFSNEFLAGQQLSIEYNLRKTWGGVDLEVDAFHYFHDIKKNRLTVEAGTNIRIIKGFFVRVSGEYELIHDQIFLPRRDASIEDILLQRKILATNYSFDLNVGLVFTFGAIYNNVVNTRL